jgi:hypothetical protein
MALSRSPSRWTRAGRPVLARLHVVIMAQSPTHRVRLIGQMASNLRCRLGGPDVKEFV